MKPNLLFEMMNAITRLKRSDMPCSHRIILIVMANFADVDGVAWPSKANLAEVTALDKATVCRALADLAEAGWLRLLERGGGRERTRYHVLTTGGAVPHLSPRATAAVAYDDSTCRPERQQLSHTTTAPVAQSDSSCRTAADHFLMEPPKNPPKDPPNEPPTGAPAREGDQAVLSLVIGGSPTSKPDKAKRHRTTRSEVPAHQRYAAAYAAGIVDAAGGVFTPPTDGHAQYVFRSVLPVHAKGADGQPLRGEALDAWIRASAAAYRRARGDRAVFEGGFKPSNWKAWLESGQAVAPNDARAPPRKARIQPGELDMDEIERNSRERRAIAERDLANGVAF